MSETSTEAAETNLAQRANDAVGSRLGAYLIDWVLLSVASVLTFFGMIIVAGIIGAAAGAGAQDPTQVSAAMQALGIVILILIWIIVGVLVFGYFTLLDSRGGTLGKRLIGLQVVTESGSPIGTKEAALRTAVLMVPFPVMALIGTLLGFIGFIIAVVLMVGWLLVEAAVIAVSDDAQRLGDKVADTFVVES